MPSEELREIKSRHYIVEFLGTLECKHSLMMESSALPEVTSSPFGRTKDGEEIKRFTFSNPDGSKAEVIELGATLTSWRLPDRNGRLKDVVLGYDTLGEYEQDDSHFGATTGRVANRICKGKFILDGASYSLAINNGPNHLHGGLVGFNKRVWKGEVQTAQSGNSAVRFSYVSKDGEEGYPGNLSVSITYSLSPRNELCIYYRATTDKPTPVNLTNHTYFNLSGEDSGETVHEHSLFLHASKYTEPDDELIPTGRILDVKGTALDFTHPTEVGKRFGEISIGGYDHNYVIDSWQDLDTKAVAASPSDVAKYAKLTAELHDPKTGRKLTMKTTEPGVQVYTAMHLDKRNGKGNSIYKKHSALCLEAQHFPDSVNQKDFPNVVLRPGQVYQQYTSYAFSCE